MYVCGIAHKQCNKCSHAVTMRTQDWCQATFKAHCNSINSQPKNNANACNADNAIRTREKVEKKSATARECPSIGVRNVISLLCTPMLCFIRTFLPFIWCFWCFGGNQHYSQHTCCCCFPMLCCGARCFSCVAIRNWSYCCRPPVLISRETRRSVQLTGLLAGWLAATELLVAVWHFDFVNSSSQVRRTSLRRQTTGRHSRKSLGHGYLFCGSAWKMLNDFVAWN